MNGTNHGTVPPPVEPFIDVEGIAGKIKTFFDRFDKKTKKRMGIGAVAVVMLWIYIVKPHPVVIDLEDYVSIEFSGYDSQGYVEIDFDEETFEKKYMKKNEHKGWFLKQYMGNYSKSLTFENANVDAMPPFVKVSVTPEKKLSNGDKVEICFEYDNKEVEEYNLKYEGDTIKKKVKRLKKAPKEATKEGED